MGLAFTYTILAIIATAANIGAQDTVIRLWTGGHGVQASMLAGTLVGLLVKYILDKHYVFSYRAVGAIEEGATFVRYGLTGIFTTTIFWTSELTFDLLFGDREMRYLGALVGLALGYLIKYRLDRRFVFPPGQG